MAFPKSWVVSVADVLVCWAVLGASVRAWSADMPAPLSAALGLIAAAVAFGLYHFAHGPPFNNPHMVLLLSGVGMLTGLFFLVSRDIYGTIVLHNFLALKGMSQALAESGRLKRFAKLQVPLVATGVATVFIFVAVDFALLRSVASGRL
jgi:hypothetical protein